jgi:hypothetical protein
MLNVSFSDNLLCHPERSRGISNFRERQRGQGTPEPDAKLSKDSQVCALPRKSGGCNAALPNLLASLAKTRDVSTPLDMTNLDLGNPPLKTVGYFQQRRCIRSRWRNGKGSERLKSVQIGRVCVTHRKPSVQIRPAVAGSVAKETVAPLDQLLR